MSINWIRICRWGWSWWWWGWGWGWRKRWRWKYWWVWYWHWWCLCWYWYWCWRLCWWCRERRWRYRWNRRQSRHRGCNRRVRRRHILSQRGYLFRDGIKQPRRIFNLCISAIIITDIAIIIWVIGSDWWEITTCLRRRSIPWGIVWVTTDGVADWGVERGIGVGLWFIAIAKGIVIDVVCLGKDGNN